MTLLFSELGPCWAHVEDTTSQPYPDEYVCPDDGVCAEYCRQASLVRNFEDDLVRAFDTSFEKVREDLGLLQLPWCERGTDGQGTSQCWDQVITDRGPCYATKGKWQRCTKSMDEPARKKLQTSGK